MTDEPRDDGDQKPSYDDSTAGEQSREAGLSLGYVGVIAMLPLLVAVLFLIQRSWAGLGIGIGVAWLVSTVLAFVDLRAARRAGHAVPEQSWANSLVLPLAYLVQRARAIGTSWWIPGVWVATAAVSAATVAGVGVEDRVSGDRIEAAVSQWVAQTGLGGERAAECPDYVGDRGEAIRCSFDDGSEVEVVLKENDDVAITIASWKRGLVEAVAGSMLDANSIGGSFTLTCPEPMSGEAFEVECTFGSDSAIRVALHPNQQFQMGFVRLDTGVVTETVGTWLRLQGVGAVEAEQAAVDCPGLDRSPAEGECRVGKRSTVAVSLTEDGVLQRVVKRLSKGLVAQAAIGLVTAVGADAEGFSPVCSALTEPGARSSCVDAEGSEVVIGLTEQGALQRDLRLLSGGLAGRTVTAALAAQGAEGAQADCPPIAGLADANVICAVTGWDDGTSVELSVSPDRRLVLNEAGGGDETPSVPGELEPPKPDAPSVPGVEQP